MFSPNQLYDYLRYYCHTNKKNTSVRHFVINGSKNLKDLSPSNSIYVDTPLYDCSDPDKIREVSGCIDMYDQEPMDIHAYYSETYKKYKEINPNAMQLEFSINDFVFSRSMAIYTPIMCHSEHNSNDINLFSDNFFSTVHFWSNAITSRYWYSHYELLQMNNTSSNKRFGAYIRSSSGTRKYRSDLLNFLKNNINHVHCPALYDINVPPTSSASIPWEDHNKFDIHIVPETIFDTEKVHLTEKIFKPIVMYQPFILFAGPNSLQYLRDYGFKTFNDVWDESYDIETNATDRFTKATKLIHRIMKLSNNDYRELIEKTRNIVEFNRNHFYSDKFKHMLLDELHDNLDDALMEQEENFYTMPGGTLFHYHDMYYQLTGNKPNQYVPNKELNQSLTPNLKHSLKYVNKISPSVANAIIKKYHHLL